MASHSGRRYGRPKSKKQAHTQKRKREDVDIDQLVQAVQELDSAQSVDKFSALPLSLATQEGLSASHYAQPTAIQKRAIPLALRGRDILGAAQTGSGKTLAFLVPVLENLYRAQHVGPDAGLGAMIISPTRELAIQIFDVLRKIGQHGHLFAAGLVIGGKSLAEERDALARMNIVVCTPGRMLQHLSQTAMFGVDSLRMLILDEADRIMDMGFQRDVDAIIEYLPPPGERQTLLFSATQTKRVSDLARLSLKDPEYISVHETANHSTPDSLQQNYIVTPLPEKLDTLWSFLCSAKKAKHLVFLSSGKQVRHVYESFRHMQPGISLLHLHGRQKQTARLQITQRFSSARHVCLFATDVAARGLDFPAVDWVVQVDCPEDADTYIHRVGRTARYARSGRAVLFLDPAEEEGFTKRLETKKVPIERIGVRAKKQKSIKPTLQGLCFKFPELKYLGQKAFMSYVRSLHVQKDSEVFPNIQKYDLESYASSMGLPGAPRIKFTRGDAEAAKRAKNAPRRGMSPVSEDNSSVDDDDVDSKAKHTNPVRTKYDRMFERRNQDILAPHYAAMIDEDETSNASHKNDTQPHRADPDEKDNIPSASLPIDDPTVDTANDLFAVKSVYNPHQHPPASDTPVPASAPNPPESKRKQKALRTKISAAKTLHPGQPGANRLVFDDETGEARPPQVYMEETAADREEQARDAARAAFVERQRRDLGERDVLDKVEAKRKRREKKEKRRGRERAALRTGVVEDEESDGELEVNDRAFEELADLYSDAEDGSEDGDGVEEEEEEPVKKRKKREHRHSQQLLDAKGDGHSDAGLDELEQAALGILK